MFTPFTLFTKAGLRHTQTQASTQTGRHVGIDPICRLKGYDQWLFRGQAPASGLGFSVCQGPAGTAAAWADFGPDYQSPSHASLRPRRWCAPLQRHHARSARPTRHGRWRWVTSLVRALALHGVAMLRSHLASPLRPGRGVLIRSVSRRLGSVACVREDASPNEVSSLTNPRMPVSLPECQTGPSSS
jgi:hypothetical protein